MMNLYFQFITGLAFVICNITASLGGAEVCEAPLKFSSIQAFVSYNCNPKSFIFENEGCKECMYIDSKSSKKIGVGFKLDGDHAKAIVDKTGADYDAIVNGPVTDFGSPCDCSAVVCLNKIQVKTLFDVAVVQAAEAVKAMLPSFSSLCCPVQDTATDVSFALDKQTLATYPPFFHWLEYQNWKAASDFLRTTEWCYRTETRESIRCNTDADILIEKGCKCSGQFSRQCFGIASACCKEAQLCCNGRLTFHNYVTKTFTETLCCEYRGGTCCPDQRCCPADNPICCPPGNCCAIDEYCKDGTCYNHNGVATTGFPAQLLSYSVHV